MARFSIEEGQSNAVVFNTETGDQVGMYTGNSSNINLEACISNEGNYLFLAYDSDPSTQLLYQIQTLLIYATSLEGSIFTEDYKYPMTNNLLRYPDSSNSWIENAAVSIKLISSDSKLMFSTNTKTYGTLNSKFGITNVDCGYTPNTEVPNDDP